MVWCGTDGQAAMGCLSGVFPSCLAAERSFRTRRELQAEHAKLVASVDEMSAQMELMAGRVQDATARAEQQEHALHQAQAHLDRKRQKKRDHKAEAQKLKQLWRTVRCVL